MTLFRISLSAKQFFTAVLLTVSLSGFGQEICNNGIDDDADGFIDLNDTVDCFCNPGNATSVPSLIPNPSFELMSTCPNYFSQITYATGWNMGTTGGTSDYLNTCGFMFSVAASAGLLPLPDGNGMAGELFGSDYKEYIGTCLSNPMTQGTPYKLNFNIASTPMENAGSPCNGGNIFYSPVDISIYGTANCNALPILAHGSGCPTSTDPAWVLLGSVTYTPNASWSLASISFTPGMNINAIMLGAPCSLPPDYPLIISFGFATCQPYFYYDNLILNRAPVFDAIGVTPAGHYCSNNIVLTANAYTTIPPGSSWQWYHNGIAIPGATGTTYNVPAGATGDYQVRLVGGTLCATSRKYTVTNAAPIISVNSPTICASTSGILTATGASTSYTWSTGATTNSIVVNPGTLTTYTVTGSVGGCTAQAVATVAINANTAAVSGNTVICPGQTTTLTASNGLYQIWDDGGTSSLNNYFTQSVTASPSITTTYTVYVTSGASGYYCIDPAVVTVSVITSFSVNATASSSIICAGSSATLTASAPGAASYNWSDGGSSTLNSYTSPTVIATPQTTTTYTVNGTLGSGGGLCAAGSVITVSVVPSPSVTIVPGSSVICAGASVTLAANATGASTYTWNTGQNTASIVVNPMATSVYTVTSSNGLCSAQATTEVSISPGPVITVNSPEICKGGTATLTASGANTYTWSNTNVTLNPQTVSPANTSTYTVMGASTLGCTSLPVTSTVTVINVIANFFQTPVLDVYPVNSTLELSNTSSGASLYQWKSCDASVFTNTTIAITLKDTGICCIQLVASKAMCFDTITKCIRVIGESEIEIPNVFTPNHDGVNDVFKVKSLGLKALSCIIYDRWGLKMSEWDTPEGYWDGRAKSGAVPSGTYFYIIHYTDSRSADHTDKGFLTLFKD
jgi:gliding motility-associated-like protein